MPIETINGSGDGVEDVAATPFGNESEDKFRWLLEGLFATGQTSHELAQILHQDGARDSHNLLKKLMF